MTLRKGTSKTGASATPSEGDPGAGSSRIGTETTPTAAAGSEIDEAGVDEDEDGDEGSDPYRGEGQLVDEESDEDETAGASIADTLRRSARLAERLGGVRGVGARGSEQQGRGIRHLVRSSRPADAPSDDVGFGKLARDDLADAPIHHPPEFWRTLGLRGASRAADVRGPRRRDAERPV